MSLIQSARASRIDNEAKRIAADVSNVASQLNALITRGLDFAAFMHTDPSSEFDSADKAMYSQTFSEESSQLLAVLQKLQPLQNIEAQREVGLDEAIAAVNAFVANHNVDINAYSKQFDR